jgi:peptidoglycan/LPS O-acetylase OafA/YrhL
MSNPRAIPTNLLLIHSFGIHQIFNWNVPSWSISAEWWAYMLFPFLAIFIYRKKGMAIGLLGLFAVLAYLSIMFWIPRVNFMNPSLPHPQNLDSTFDFGFLRGLAGFISGMIVYKLYQAGSLANLFQKDITAAIIIIGCILSMHLAWNDGFNIIFFVLLVLAFALNNAVLHKICNGRILQYLGKISYSIYLMQLFALIPLWAGLKLPGLVYKENSVTTTFRIGAGWCLVYMLIVIGLASLTYFTVEKPCRRYINAKWGKEKMPVYA